MELGFIYVQKEIINFFFQSFHPKQSDKATKMQRVTEHERNIVKDGGQ